MEKKKYELTNETIKLKDKVLYRIKALKDFSTIKSGDLGGWIEKEDNLSQEGDCWIYDDAKVYGTSRVRDNAKISGNAHVVDAYVFHNAKIYDNARVSDTIINGSAKIGGTAWVSDNTIIGNDARILSDKDYVYISGLGEIGGLFTFYRCENSIKVHTPSFDGTLDRFVEYITDVRRGVYQINDVDLILLQIEVIKRHFNITE